MTVPDRVPAGAGGRPSTERRALLTRLQGRLAGPGARVLLVGPPGIGKTTLLEDLVARARDAGVTVLHARAAEAAARPFQGLVDLLAPVPEELLTRLPELQQTALEVALARRPGGAPLPAMALPSAVVAVVRELADRDPVLVAVDDWPWLDPETAELVRHLLDRPGPTGRGLGLLATARTDWLGQDGVLPGLQLPRGTDLEPVPALSREGLREVLTTALGRPPAPEQLEDVHRVTDGNPLWAVELQAARHRRLPGVGSGEHPLPRSVAEALLARVQALAPAAREVLAVVGAAGGMPPAAAADLVEDGATGLVQALDSGVVREADRRLVPAHPLLATAALRVLGLAGRMHLHRRLAAVAETDAERAEHLDRATPPGPDEDVAVALTRAGEECRRRGAPASALVRFERALARSAPDAPARPARLAALAETAFALGDLERTRALLTTLDAAAVPLDVLDRALPLLVDAVTVTAGEPALADLVARLRAQLAGSPVRQAVVDVYRAELTADPAAERLGRAERVLAVLPPGGGEVPAARHRALGAALLAGVDLGRGIARDRLAELAELEQGRGVGNAKSSALTLLGVHAYQVADDLATSRSALRQLVATADGAGEELMAAFLSAHLAVVELLAGDLPGARMLLERLASVGQSWGADAPPSMVRSRGLVALSGGGVAAVDALLAEVPEPAGSPEYRAVRRGLAGIARARSEDWAAALPLLEEARAVSAAMGKDDPGRRLWVDVDLGEALVALGRPAEAVGLADGIGRIAALGERPLLRAQELRLRGLVAAASGDLARAEVLLADAVATVTPTGFLLEQGLAQLALGRVLRRRRAHRRAGLVLAEVRALAERLDDQPFRARVDRVLGGATTSRGDDVLTPAEERVATAAAAGTSNAEIAAALFLSVRTVETHLRSVYRKLGLRSRAQLAAHLAARPDRAG